ncbi:MAG: hypothetical protein AAGJ80_19905, partial [Cyanobacteria bacterium J06553_1]
MKLPEFISSDPATWFHVTEAYFATKKIVKEDEKYNHIVAALPAKVTVLLRDVLTMTAEQEAKQSKFQALKDRLLALFAQNPFEAYMTLHNFPVLASSQKPLALLSAMMAVVPAEVVVEDSWQFKMLFLSKLP